MNLLTNRIERARTLPVLTRELEKACAKSRNSLTDMAIRHAHEVALARLERNKRKRRNRKQRKQEKALTVAIYDCNRYEGGPEEGGWWYDAGTLVSVEGTYWNQDHAYAACRALNDWCAADNEANERRPISSVLCDGVLQARIEACPAPAYFPAQRPRYE